jgi:uncharacterized protein YbjQ (UPF0145 family)
MPGLVVVELDPSGQAAKIGIKIHDVLYKYNGALLSSIEDLVSARATKVENELIAIRGKELKTFTSAGGSLGVSLVPYPIPDVNIAGVGEVLARFSNEDIGATQAEREAQQAERLLRISSIQVTTTPQLEGYRVIKTLDIITAEYVGGMNMFRDIFSAITDIVGGRSGTMQNELRAARETCIANLKMEADRIGANAVIGVDLDYSEISGGGKSMLFLVASGTAVMVEKI